MFIELAVTVVSGAVLYGFKRFVADPIFEYRQTRKTISKDLVNYADVLANPRSTSNERSNEAKQVLREDVSELKSAADDIPLYRLWSILKVVPSKEDIDSARGDLIGLSNSTNSGDPLRNHEMKQEAIRLLGLEK